MSDHIATAKVETQSGTRDVPLFDPADLSETGWLRIDTPSGTGALRLVDVENAGLDDLRVQTPGGLKAVAQTLGQVPAGIARWQFNDSSTTGVATDSVGDNDGSIVGDTAYTEDAQEGSHALDFLGGADYVDIPSSILGDNQSYSVSLWARKADSTTGVAVQFHNTRFGITFGARDSNGWEGTVWDGGSRVTVSSGDMTAGSWIMLTLVYDDGQSEMEFYVNDVSQGAAAVDFAPEPTNSSAIGAQGDGTTGYFEGTLDDVRVFDLALTDSQVSELYSGV